MPNVTRFFLFYILFLVVTGVLAKPSWTERELTFTTTDALTLHGTLTLPSDRGKKFPAVVFVSDLTSDRDGTIGTNKPLANIAHAIAERGIASYRFDRRSVSVQKNFPFVTAETDYVADAAAAIEAMSHVAEIDSHKIVAFGHGIGGFMMPFIANASPRLRGIILAAAPARRIDYVLTSKMRYRAQATGMDSSTVESQEVFISMMFTKIAKGKGDKTQGFLGQSFTYWSDLYERNPLLTLLDVKKPVLVLEAEKDFEATTEDFDKWRQMLSVHGNNNDRAESFHELNHLFNHIEGPSTGNEYEKSGEVDDNVIILLSSWIKNVTKN